jgi:hypothetical protein
MQETSTAHPPRISHRLIPEAGVIVVEIQQALGPADFAALAATADDWIKTHGSLSGLVLHAHHFPGWESLRGALSHLRFVRDHHKEVKRVALVTEARLASIAEHLAQHFLKAEVKVFAFDKLEEATAWAGRRETQ